MARKSLSRLRNVVSDDYTAPALEKGLDILELLAEKPQGMTLRQMAEALGRTSSEIFRMAVVLVSRGYLHKRDPGDTYELTSKLFELSHRHPPTRRLLDVALPLMRRLAESTAQSCHLSAINGVELLVLAHVDSPETRSLVVRAGTRAGLLETASGVILLAFADAYTREEILKELDPTIAFVNRLEMIRQRGYEQHRSQTIRGVIDLSTPIVDHLGHALAAVTVPYLTPRRPKISPRETLDRLIATTRQASTLLGGQQES